MQKHLGLGAGIFLRLCRRFDPLALAGLVLMVGIWFLLVPLTPRSALPTPWGVVTTLVYSGVVSFILLKVIDMVMGIRVTEEQEREGLDVSLHGEHVE